MHLRWLAAAALGGLFVVHAHAASWSASYSLRAADGSDSTSVIRQASDGGFFLLTPSSSPSSLSTNGMSALRTRRGSIRTDMNHVRCDSYLSAPRKFIVTRTNASGGLRWSYEYSLAACTSGNDLAATEDGGAVVLGSVEGPIPYPGLATPIVLKLDADGNILWQTKLARASLTLELVPRSIKATPGGGALVALGAFVVRLSPAGAIELEHSLVNRMMGDVIVNDVLPAEDGYFAVGMACRYTPDSEFCSSLSAFASRISATGVLQWAKLYTDAGVFQSVQRATSSIVYAETLSDNGLPRIYQLDDDGTVRWAISTSGLSLPWYSPGAIDPAGGIWWPRLDDEAGNGRVLQVGVDGTPTLFTIGTPDWSESVDYVTGTAGGIATLASSAFGAQVIHLEPSEPGCIMMTTSVPNDVYPFDAATEPLPFGVSAAGITGEELALLRTCLSTTMRRECEPAEGAASSRFRPRTEAVSSCGLQLDFEFAQPQKVLLHKYGSGDDYPSEYQRRVTPSATISGRDRHIEVRARVTGGGTPVPDHPVYFRVTDPRDTSAYAAADAQPGDNADPNPTGDLLVLEPCTTTTPLPAGVVCALSAPDGYARVILRTSEHIAGENYHVQGSFDDQFTCAPACAQSGRIETWKRVYLEVGRMFKKGSYVLQTSAAGSSTIDVADATKFNPGDRVVVLYGPPLPRTFPPSPGAYQAETRIIQPAGVVVASPGPAGTLKLDAPIPVARGIDSSVDRPSLVADFVGIVTGNDANDYYEANLTYVPALFTDAFVEYEVMAPVPLPLVDRIDENVDAMIPINDESNNFARRWFRHLGSSNHQFMMGIRETTSAEARGVTRAVEGFSYSHVMVRRLLGTFATAASRRLLGEATAHEVSHQWHTNRPSSHTSNRSHCNSTFRYWDDATKLCLMYYTYENSATGVTLPEFTDDIVRFHYRRDTTGVDSEYRWIRERCEPIPANPFTGTFDWWATLPTPCR